MSRELQRLRKLGYLRYLRELKGFYAMADDGTIFQLSTPEVRSAIAKIFMRRLSESWPDYRKPPEIVYVVEGVVSVTPVVEMTQAVINFLPYVEFFMSKSGQVKAADLSRRLHHYQRLLKFDGAPLLVKESDHPDAETILKAVGLAPGIEQDTFLEAEEATKGRPRKIEDTASYYSEAFPDGHAGVSQKAVVKHIKERFGFVTSTDTLRRALAFTDNNGQ